MLGGQEQKGDQDESDRKKGCKTYATSLICDCPSESFLVSWLDLRFGCDDGDEFDFGVSR